MTLCREDVNVVDDYDETALHWLARDKEAAVESVQFLLQHGADVNRINAEGESALHLVMLAAIADPGHYILQKAVLLINHGADVNAADNEGCTPVIYAATAMDNLAEPLVQLLCAAGAELQHTDINGETALMKAAASSCTQIFKQLGVSITTLNLQDFSGRSALHHCLSDEVDNSQQSEAASLLLDMGADPLTQDEEGCNALHLVVRSSHVAFYVVKRIATFLSRRSAINVTDKDGQTALIRAIDNSELDNSAVVELLLSLGAACNLR